MSSAGGDGGASIELGAALLGSTTLTKGKYNRIWRRSLYIRFLISTKKPSTSSTDHDSTPSPSPAETFSSKSCVTLDIEDSIRSDTDGIVKDQGLISLPGLGGQGQHTQKRGAVDEGNPTVPLPVFGIGYSKSLLNSYKCYRCTIMMLLVSAGLSFTKEFKQEGPKHGWYDGIAISFGLVLLVLGKPVANFYCERKKLKLKERKKGLDLGVNRGEESLVVPLSDIVAGDTVCLRPGDEVPEDGELESDGILVLVERGEIKS